MFDLENFVTEYVEMIKADVSEETMMELTKTLPTGEASDFYIDVSKSILAKLKEEDEVKFATEINRLDNTVELMQFMATLADKNSDTPAVTTEIGLDTAAFEPVEEESTEAAAPALKAASEGEVDGDAPTVEVEKSK